MRDLDNIEAIRKIDKSNMLEILCGLPRQCEEAEQIGAQFKAPENYKDFNQVVFTGLGGSAISGDLVKSYLNSEINLPVVVNRDYNLPEFVDEKSLVLVVSYSGNTEETLSAYNEAKQKKAKIIAVTSGGKLSESAKKEGFPCITIPGGLPPRTALGYLFLSNLNALIKIGLIKDKDSQVKKMIGLLKELRDEVIGPDLPHDKNLAKGLALKLYGKLPVIYGAYNPLETAVTRWRTQISENSNTLASSHVFPEMNHNEIVGWENPKKLLKDFLVVILRDESEHERIKKRIEITKSIIRKENIEIEEVWPRGEDLLSRIFSLIYIGDFVSFYLAVLNGVDPTSVKRIDYLKKQLAKGGNEAI